MFRWCLYPGTPLRLDCTQSRLSSPSHSLLVGSVRSDKVRTLTVPRTAAGTARSTQNRSRARQDSGASLPGTRTSHSTSTGTTGRLPGAPLPPGTPARGLKCCPSKAYWSGRGERGSLLWGCHRAPWCWGEGWGPLMPSSLPRRRRSPPCWRLQRPPPPGHPTGSHSLGGGRCS